MVRCWNKVLIFLPVKKKIYVICPFPKDEAAGQRLKYEQYLEQWENKGYQVSISNFMDLSLWAVVYTRGNYLQKFLGVLRGYIKRFIDIFYINKADIVYVFMWGTPFGSSLYERIVRLLSKNLIYDIEDNVMMSQTNSLNPIMRFLRGTSKVNYLIQSSNHVITSSPYLCEYAKKINNFGEATYISSSINTTRFIPANHFTNNKPIVLGWTGTFSSKEYLELLEPMLIKLAAKKKFKLRIIGNFEYSLPGVDTEIIKWTKKNEVSDLQGIDIGLYPLPQNDWVLGKSGLKALQYMAFGLPTVATDVGTTPMIIQNMENGILVKSEEDWLDALEMLMNDNELRKKLGENARRTVLENYSTNVISSKYLKIIKSLIGDHNE